ncbi:hypothetical protein Trihar35433_7955 [Trichoderma harzianum]|nr:hypothetical protein Trihar35433_7955 [Trichoderma harzianum]
MPVSSGFHSSSSSESIYDRPSRRKDFQIAIICALSLEYDATALIVDEFWDQEKQYGRTSGDTNIYRNGRIGMHNVVLMLLPNMGKAAVAGSAASLRTSYSNLRIAFLVGVCGGVPILGAHEALLGDVAIGEAIIQYDFGRQYPGEFIPKETAIPTQSLPNKDIRTLLAYLKSDTGKADLRQNTAKHLKALQGAAVLKKYEHSYRYPGFAEDKLFVATYRHKHRGGPSGVPCCESESYCDNAAQSSCSQLGCDEKKLVQRHRLERKRDLSWEEAQCPDIFIRRVASADTVMKSGDHRDQIAKQYNIIAFEMEGAGLWDECPCIVVKGICDYSDSHKSKVWQPFAAATAAAAVKAIAGSAQPGQIVPVRHEITHHRAEKSSSGRIPNTTKSNGTQTLRDSILDFQSVLAYGQQRELQSIKMVPDASAVLVFTAELDSLNRDRKGCSIASRLHSVLQSVRDFSAAVEAVDSTHQGIASILWGSVKLTMLVTVKSITYDEALSKLFMDLGRICPRWTDYQIFYSSSSQLQEALHEFYASLIRCCKRAVETVETAQCSYEFNTWISSRDFSLLWCSGKIGSGKTTLTASVIEKLLTKERSPDVFISFFFVRFDDRQSLNAEIILKSIIRQMLNVSKLYEKVETLLDNMQLNLASGLDEIAKLLQSTAAEFKKLYIVIDGLDECTKSERHDLLEILRSVLNVRSNTKLFLAGRDSVSREVQIKFPTLKQISMDCSSAQSDIATYVEGIVQEKLKTEELIVGDPDLIEDIKAALSDGANGMFLWVIFQVNELCLQHCDEDIRTAIQNFPKDLEETFNRAIDRIVSHGDQDIAKRIFRWVAAAKEPLSLDQLKEIIFVEIGQEYSKTERQSNGIAHISSWCENLVHVDEELKTVQFVHQSVQRFFIERSSESRHNQFYLNLEDADHYLGEICVTYLNFNDFKTTLARRQQPLPPMPPIAMAGTALRPQWKAVLSIPALLKLNLDTRGGSTASNAIEALGTFQRDDTGSAKEELHVRHPFLGYASIHWISHTTMFQKENSKTWNSWERMIVQGHDLVKKPWIEWPFDKSIGAILDWSQNFHHYALIRLVLLRGMLSVSDRGRVMQNAVNCGDIMLLDILLEREEPGSIIIDHACEVAVKRGRLDALKRLLAAGADGQTALDGAAISGHQNIIMHLLSAGVDGLTALNTAAQNGDVSAVKSLLDAGVDGPQLLRDLIDEALFHMVDQEGARAVLDNPNTDHDGIKVLKILVGAGVDGQPILQTAIQGSSRLAIALLLAAGVDANGVDAQAALFAAAKQGYLAVIEKLLAAGVQMSALTARTPTGQSGLQIAAQWGHINIIEGLLPSESELYVGSTWHIQSALYAASRWDHLDIFERLLDAGASVDDQSIWGNQPALQAASEGGHLDIVERLLAAGSQVNAYHTWGGQSALEAASGMGHLDVVERHLAAGAKVNTYDTPENPTALQAACQGRHLGVVKRLLGWS